MYICNVEYNLMEYISKKVAAYGQFVLVFLQLIQEVADKIKYPTFVKISRLSEKFVYFYLILRVRGLE